MGGKNENKRVAYPESVPIHLKSKFLIFQHDLLSNTAHDLLVTLNKTIREVTNHSRNTVYSNGLSNCANLTHIFLKQIRLSLSKINMEDG